MQRLLKTQLNEKKALACNFKGTHYGEDRLRTPETRDNHACKQFPGTSTKRTIKIT